MTYFSSFSGYCYQMIYLEIFCSELMKYGHILLVLWKRTTIVLKITIGNMCIFKQSKDVNQVNLIETLDYSQRNLLQVSNKEPIYIGYRNILENQESKWLILQVQPMKEWTWGKGGGGACKKQHKTTLTPSNQLTDNPNRTAELREHQKNQTMSAASS